MRHLYGIGLAVVMILIMFFGGAWGYLRLLRLPGQGAALPANGGSLLSYNSALAALGAVAATGLMAGILVAVPRISPLAAGLPGLLLMGPGSTSAAAPEKVTATAATMQAATACPRRVSMRNRVERRSRSPVTSTNAATAASSPASSLSLAGPAAVSSRYASAC